MSGGTIAIADANEGQRTDRPRREAQIGLLVSGLVAGLSVDAAADAADLARTTAYDLMKRGDVRQRLSDASREATSAAARRAAGLVCEAVEILGTLARSAQSESVRRQAASDLLGHARAFKLDSEVEERVLEISRELDLVIAGGVQGGR